MNNQNDNPLAIDPEAQAAMARLALLALDDLLNGLPPGQVVDGHRIGAMVHLINQAQP